MFPRARAACLGARCPHHGGPCERVQEGGGSTLQERHEHTTTTTASLLSTASVAVGGPAIIHAYSWLLAAIDTA